MPTQRFESLGTRTQGAANVRSTQLARGSSPLRPWQFDECDPGWGRPVGKRKSLWVPKTSSGPVNRMNGLKLWSVSTRSWR